MNKIFVLLLALFVAAPSFGTSAKTCAIALSDKSATADYAGIQREFNELVQKIPAAHRKSLEHLLDSVEFFDYSHTAHRLLNNFLEDGRDSFDFSRIYDRDEESGAPFQAFMNARQYLKEKSPALSVDLIQEIHRRVMSGGVAGLASGKQGVIRSVPIFGNSAGSFRMTVDEAKIIEENPYLSFTSLSQSPAALNNSVWQKVKIWTSDLTLQISEPAPTLVDGHIIYPDISKSKDETIAIIKNSHPELWLSIGFFRKNQPDGKNPELEQKFIRALLEERIHRFEREASEVIAKNSADMINLIADFQRDLIAIHPFEDGNGRSSRLLMNHLLTSKGFAPVRLVDPFLDIQLSQNAWKQSVRMGVSATNRLLKDLSLRLRQGLTAEYSPELLYPALPEQIWINEKKAGSTTSRPNGELVEVESRQFTAFLQTTFAAYPLLKTELKNDRLRTMNRLASLFVDWYHSKTIDYIHEKDGERDIKLRFVEPDFVDLFGVVRAERRDLWDAKINQWYEKDMMLWRGISNQSHEFTDMELAKAFVSPTTHLASNQVARSGGDGSALINKMKAEFRRYNQELLNGKLIQQAADHANSGPTYGTSYGYSTSKREVVGKAFAMGAMVIAPYGEQNNPEIQKKLKSRINMASYRALKDVDLGRLRAFEQSFSYEYGRQAEVMGIGGTDPDAIMIIQRIDADGEVADTFVRNPEQPDQIFKIAGHYLLTDGPIPKDRVTEGYLIRDGKITLSLSVPAPIFKVKKQIRADRPKGILDHLRDWLN